MRANSVIQHPSSGSPPDFGAVGRETSPLLSARLIPGDWLYISSPWWHLVYSREEALSISIGVLPHRPVAV
jgi:ribosomal protein L16 Arg81 hydroxylase